MKTFDFLLGKGHVLHKDKTAPFPLTTVLIPAYNEEETIASTIRSVLFQTVKPHRVIVVDDCSTDSTASVVKTFPGVELYTLPKNSKSKARALSQAVDLVDTEIAVFVDADTVLFENSLEELLYAFQDPKTGIACGSPFTKTFETFFEKARFAEYILSYGLVKSGQQNFKSVLVATGCFFGIRTELLKSLGGFDDRTFAEDMDLTWKMMESTSFDVAYAKDSQCLVSDPKNWNTYKEQMRRWIHGFFQCFRVRNMNTFGRLRLGLFSYFYFSGVLVFWGFVAFLFTTPSPLFLYGFAAYQLILLWIGTRTASSIGYRKRDFWRCYPSYLITQTFINPLLYSYFFVREFVFQKSVGKWVKGH